MKRKQHERRPQPPPPARRWNLTQMLLGGIIAGAAIFGVQWAVRHRAGGGTPPKPAPNILLITLDTTRADRIGAYGYARTKTTHIDRLAAEGVRFDRAIAPAPITLPSHASLFTARYPFAHGVRNNGNFYLADSMPTLATALHDRGYHTAAFVSSFILDRRYGLARGFDEYDDRFTSGAEQVVNFLIERRGDRTALMADQWLERHAREASRPFFVWLHLYDPHEPYRPPQPFRDMFADRPYDGEIAFVDTIVASVVDRLRALSLLDNTVIAIVGDHGESLGDHGEETHSMFVYTPVLRVPMILWGPGHVPQGRVVAPLVRLIDLAPTLLDIAGAPPLAGAQGEDLMPLIAGRAPAPASAYAETYLPLFYMNWAPLRALQDERWKYIDAPTPELYDLERDGAEATNLAAREPSKAAAMKRALDGLTGAGHGSMTVGRLDREALEKLAALGYVGAGNAPSADATDAKPDPKTMIAVFNELRTANTDVRQGRFDEAIRIAREVLARDPHNAFATIVVASAEMNRGRYREAIAGYRAYLDLVPTSAYAHHWIAICYLRLEEPDRALEEESAALAIDPKYADARVLRGGVLASRGKFDDAIRELNEAVATDPDKPALRLDVARVLTEAKRFDEADAQYRRALELAPNDLDAHTGYGVLLASRGRLDQAAAEFRRVLQAQPGYDEVRFNLAKVLEQLGRQSEARVEYETVAGSSRAAAPVRHAARERLDQLR